MFQPAGTFFANQKRHFNVVAKLTWCKVIAEESKSAGNMGKTRQTNMQHTQFIGFGLGHAACVQGNSHACHAVQVPPRLAFTATNTAHSAYLDRFVRVYSAFQGPSTPQQPAS